MILQINPAGLQYIAVERPARWPGNLGLVVYRNAVMHYS